MENEFTPELIEKAKQAKSAEELTELAKENGVDISEDDAREYFEQSNKSGELSDDELDDVSGGKGGGSKNIARCHHCGGKLVYKQSWGAKKWFYYVCLQCGRVCCPKDGYEDYGSGICSYCGAKARWE